MFKMLRNKKTQKKIWIILAILILPAFLFWGFGSIMRSQRGLNYAGRIRGRKISLLEYQDAFRAIRNQALIALGEDFFKLEKQLNLESQVWDRLLLSDETKRRKIKANDSEVTNTIENYPFFQKNSKFDLETYNRLLRFFFHTSARVFEEQIRDSIKIRKLYTIVTSGVQLTEEEIKNEYKKEGEQARVDYLNALPLDFVKNVQIEELQIEDYFKNNALEFKKPQSFSLEYLEILYPQDANESDINTIDEKARAIFLKLRKEKDILKVVKETSLEIRETGFFSLNDPIPGIGWSPEIIDVITKLKTRQLGIPIHTSKGWYFIKLKEKRESYIPNFQEVKNQAREKLIQLKSKEIANKKIEATLSKIKDIYKINPRSIDFNKLAKEFNLKTGETQFFKRASYIPGIGTSDKFFDAILNMKAGELSPILDMEQGFYIVRLKEYKGIDEQKYLKEKEDFSLRLEALKKEKAFMEFLQRLMKEATLEVNLTPPKTLP